MRDWVSREGESTQPTGNRRSRQPSGLRVGRVVATALAVDEERPAAPWTRRSRSRVGRGLTTVSGRKPADAVLNTADWQGGCCPLPTPGFSRCLRRAAVAGSNDL